MAPHRGCSRFVDRRASVNDAEYLRQVEVHLTDLPWRARKNLVADLRGHLAEVPTDDDLVIRLGNPQSYAGELRAAAGLEPRRGPLAFIRARRPRNVAIAVALLVIAAALTAAVIWASHYQPLSTGNVWQSPLVSHPGAAGETVAPYLNRKPFQYGVSIRNSGRFPVRILGIPLDPEFSLPWKVRPYMVTSETNFAKGPEPFHPFHPFTLKPGHQRLIVLRGVYANCKNYISNSGVNVSAIRVRERFLLWTHTVWIDLPGALVVTMPRHKNPCATG